MQHRQRQDIVKDKTKDDKRYDGDPCFSLSCLVFLSLSRVSCLAFVLSRLALCLFSPLIFCLSVSCLSVLIVYYSPIFTFSVLVPVLQLVLTKANGVIVAMNAVARHSRRWVVSSRCRTDGYALSPSHLPFQKDCLDFIPTEPPTPRFFILCLDFMPALSLVSVEI